MTAIQLFLAIGLPWLVGVLLICCVCHLLRNWIPKTIIVGYGFMLGMVLVTLIMRVAPLSVGLISSIVVILCCCLVIVLRRQLTFSKLISIADIQLNAVRFSWSGMFAVCLVGLIALHCYLVAINVLIKPLFAWDAWATWSVKARTWFELKQMVAFVGHSAWLDQADRSAHVLDAWNYPDTAPLIQTWVALVVDRWDDALINLPWLFCFIALGVGFYGQLRLLQISRMNQLIAVYLIISLPLLNTHIAMAGYADLWLSTAFTFTVLALMQSMITGSVVQLLLALFSACCVVLFKTEGVVLLLTLIPLCLAMKLPPALLKKFAVMSVVSLIGLILILFVFSPIQLSIPYLGEFSIAYHSVWGAMRINYFELPNWHLLCYVVSVGFLYAMFAPSVSALQRKLILTLVVSLLGYLFVLFFLTQNYSWAERYSSVNRITLHLLPSVFFCVLLIFDQRFKNRHVLSKAT
jgi:hypothetical protein